MAEIVTLQIPVNLTAFINAANDRDRYYWRTQVMILFQAQWHKEWEKR